MLRIGKIIFLVLIAGICRINAQNMLWEQSYGGIHGEYLLDAIATADYGFILAGSSVSGNTGNKKQANEGNLDYWLWKMNEHGQQEWQKNIGGTGRDMLYSISTTNDGGFILGGSSDSDAKPGVKKQDCKGGEDYWVVKLDARGDILWERTIGGRGQDVLTKIIALKDGGYLLGGSSNSDKSEDKAKNCYGGLDFWVIKLDKDGKTEWEKTLGGKYDDVLRTMIITNDGGYLIGGYTNSPESDDKKTDNLSGDFWVIKLNKSGDVVWERTIGGDGQDDLSVLLQTKDGNYIAGGHSDSSPAKNGVDVLLVKFDEKGIVKWEENYDVGAMDLLTSLVENPDSTLVAGINSKGGGLQMKASKKKEGIDDYMIMKLSDKGEEKWKRNFGSSGVDILKKIIISRDGGYVLAGTSKSNRPSENRTNQIGGTDFWVVKLGDKDKDKVVKEPLEAFPNPAQDFTNIIVGEDYEKGSISVFDINGRKIQSFEVDGNRTIPISLAGLPAGVYIVQIKTDVQEEGIKILKK